MPTLSSGVTSGVTFSSGTTWPVLSAAEVENSFVQHGASIFDSGGQLVSNTVSGYVVVYSGAISANTIGASGQLAIEGGSAVNDIVSNGGLEETLVNGGTTGTIVLSGGLEFDDAKAVSIVLSGGTEDINGGVDSGAQISAGGVQKVFGGSAVSATVFSGGVQSIGINGSVVDTTVLNGGEIIVADNETPDSGVTVDSGGIAAFGPVIVYEGDTLVLSATSTQVLSTTVSSGVTLLSGAYVTDYDIFDFGTLTLSAGVVTSDVTVDPTGMITGAGSLGGAQNIDDGVIDGATILSGAGLIVNYGGTVLGASISGVDVAGGAQLTVSAGGSGTGDMVAGVESLFGTESNLTVLFGGVVTVNSGAVVSGATAAAGAVLDVKYSGRLALSPGGPDVAATVSNGGVLELIDPVVEGGSASPAEGGVVTATEVVSGVTLLSGALLFTEQVAVTSGGVLYTNDEVTLGDIIQTGGREAVAWRGVVSSAYVSGGYLAISNYGSAYNVTLVAGGSDRISSGGYTAYTTAGSGGTEAVLSGGFSADATVLAGGLIEAWANTAEVVDALVDAGGVSLKSGGEALDSTVESGGYEFAQAGGKSFAATILAGGIDYAGSGGEVANAAIDGGAVKVEASGSAVDTILKGGGLIVSSGGVAIDTVISGGTEIVGAGGTDSGAILSGGKFLLSSGGVLADGLTLAGGTATIAGAISAGQIVNFVSGGVDLVLDNLPGFSATISNFRNANQKIDLAGFAYSSTGETVSWTQSGGGVGALTVTDGAKVARLILDGYYYTSNFHLSDDGHGGTYVVDPPSKPAMFAQTMAAFGAGAGGAGAGSINGFTGSALLDAPPLVPTGTGSAVR